MKKIFLFTILSLCVCPLFAQIHFEKGYFVDNDNHRVDCWIKNVDWRFTPKQFDCQLTENGQTLTKFAKDVTEFGILNEPKFVKAIVQIDLSDQSVKNLDEDGLPHFTTDTLFLKVLVEGEAKLYVHQKPSYQYFFYKLKENKTEPLVYKQFLKDARTATENTQFQTQLMQFVYCPKTSNYNINGIKYNEKELIKYFETYNSCFNTTILSLKKLSNAGKKQIFNFKITGGVNSSHCIVSYGENPIIFNFDRLLTATIGAEIEAILPFNKNKWGISLSPNYNSHNGQAVSTSGIGTLKYKYIDVPLSLRYYMYLPDNKQKVFLSGALVYYVPFNSQFDYDQRTPLDMRPSYSFSAGLGYAYGPISGEVRVFNQRKILDFYVYNFARFSKASFVLSYRF